MLLSTFTEILEFFKKPYPIKLEQHHIDFADSQTWCKSRTHADCLIFEYDLITKGYMLKPKPDLTKCTIEEVRNGTKYIPMKSHDGQFGNPPTMCVDFKEIIGTYHNIYEKGKLDWMRTEAIEGNLTHFVPYKVINRDRLNDFRNNRLYKVGETLEIQVMEIAPARPYLKRRQFSIREGCYCYIMPEQKI